MKKWTLLFFLLPFVVYAQQIDLDKVPYKSALVHLLHANNHIQPIDTTDTGYSTLQYHSFSSKGQFINVRHQQYLTDYLLFNIHFDKAFDAGLDADMSGLGELLSMDDSSVSISKKEEGGILFSGSKYKTFAFQLVELELEDDGLYIKQILADNDHKVLRENGQLPRSVISDEFVMFDLDPINEPAI